MGFGPTMPDPIKAQRAVREIIELLYPERATPSALSVLERLANTLLKVRAPLSFESMARFLNDPGWRAALLKPHPDVAQGWQDYTARPIDPTQLDPDFAWLLADRLQALREGKDKPSPPSTDGP